jgi:hypothetical protein
MRTLRQAAGAILPGAPVRRRARPRSKVVAARMARSLIAVAFTTGCRKRFLLVMRALDRHRPKPAAPPPQKRAKVYRIVR